LVASLVYHTTGNKTENQKMLCTDNRVPVSPQDNRAEMILYTINILLYMSNLLHALTSAISTNRGISYANTTSTSNASVNLNSTFK